MAGGTTIPQRILTYAVLFSMLVAYSGVDGPAAVAFQEQAQNNNDLAGQRCDELAASPSDQSKNGASVELDKIEIVRALPACQEAAQMSPVQPRYLFQFGRVLEAEKHYQKAFQEYSRATEMGYVAAMERLGALYLYGRGVSQSDTNAVAWFGKATEMGNTAAMFDLGWMYEHGRGVVQSDADAVAWYRKAADSGYPNAMTGLGWMLRQGRGITWNEREAMVWFEKAADLGNANGETSLAFGYMNGLGGGRQDYGLAARWFSTAADQGDGWAQFYLGILYQNGWGVERSAQAAKTYYGNAAKSDDRQIAQAATERLQFLEKESSDATAAAVVAGAALLAILAAASSDKPSKQQSYEHTVDCAAGNKADRNGKACY